jgi:hypothetical protein
LTDPPLKKEGFIFLVKTDIFIFVCTTINVVPKTLYKNYYALTNKRTSQKKIIIRKMTNRDLLKEAIADAKAVKEVAITNAKAALEEAFTPHLKEMFEKKMMDMEEEEDDVKTEAMEANDDKELEELLRELEGSEDEEAEEEEEAEDDAEEAEDDAEEVEIDLEDMTEEDLKKFIEDVVDEMIEAGELEAGHEGMEDEAGMEMEPEMGAEEAPAEEETPMMEMKDSENLSEIIDLSPDQIAMLPGLVATTLGGLVGGGALLAYKDEIMAAVKKAIGKVAGKGAQVSAENLNEIIDLSPDQIAMLPGLVATTVGGLVGGGTLLAYKDEIMAAVKKAISSVSKKGAPAATEAKHEEELAEAMRTIKMLKSELNEINLLNSKLLYTNKIFKAKNLTEAQKVKVLTAFDKAETVKEVKLVFETLNEGLEKAGKKELVRENKGFASKAIGVSPKQPVVETNDMVNRFKKLAGL